MRCIKPMKIIMTVLCTFGLVMGIIFPIYAGFFVEWIPSKKLAFDIGCLIAGCFVGLFSFYVVNFILKSIDRFYKEILSNHLKIDSTNKSENNGDLLLNMKSDFEKLIKNYSSLIEKENVRLKELSITDCLTSAYNKGYLYEYFEKKVPQEYSNVTLLFCDIDDFKKVNDEYGHIVGDYILKKVSEIIRICIPENNKLFRYGGEEFAILLMNYTSKEAYKLAEDIRLKIKDSDSIQAYCNFKPVTVSIGLSSYPFDASDIESLINKADEAMYYAKQNGKNLCIIYTPELSQCKKNK